MITIIAIDMSKAFDSIDRHKLMEVLSKITNETNCNIIRYLLHNTFLTTKIGDNKGDPFQTGIGVPQGDALSPVLFTIYLEAAFREFRTTVSNDHLLPGRDFLFEVFYADDSDIITNVVIDSAELVEKMQITLEKWNLKVNAEKTEFTTLTKENARTVDVKKLGSKIGDNADINIRIKNSNSAFNSMWKVWRSKHIARSTKIRLYKACILPILMYNMAAISTTNCMINKLDTTFRRHIRHICCSYYPHNRMHNYRIYNICNMIPLAVTIVQRRWQLLGHIMRLEQVENIPAYFVMQYYYYPLRSKNCNNSGTEVNFSMCLPKHLSSDLKRLAYSAVGYKRGMLKLATYAEFCHMKQLAQDRKTWRALVDDIVKCTFDEYLETEVEKVTKRQVTSNKSRTQKVGTKTKEYDNTNAHAKKATAESYTYTQVTSEKVPTVATLSSRAEAYEPNQQYRRSARIQERMANSHNTIDNMRTI